MQRLSFVENSVQGRVYDLSFAESLSRSCMTALLSVVGNRKTSGREPWSRGGIPASAQSHTGTRWVLFHVRIVTPYLLGDMTSYLIWWLFLTFLRLTICRNWRGRHYRCFSWPYQLWTTRNQKDVQNHVWSGNQKATLQNHCISIAKIVVKNKRPMGHIAHLKSINTYDYTLTLIKRRKKHY